MTDLHTHILPGMDDGAPDAETSIAMLRMEQEQGIDTVALTPHFYRNREKPLHFLERRQKAAEKLLEALKALPEDERKTLPRLTLGAEVAWIPGMADWEELPELCYAGTTFLQIELPFHPWDRAMFQQLYDLMGRTGLTPVIAHLDRYIGIQSKDRIDDLLDMDIPFQLSAEAMLHFFTRRQALSLLRSHQTRLLISDCHGVKDRAPNMGAALEMIRKKMDAETVKSISWHTDELLKRRR